MKRGLQQKDWASPVLLRLHARVEEMAAQDQLNPQASANVLWSIAQLSDRFRIPTKLLIALVKSLPTKVKGMNPQELSNCMWACAKLKEIAPDVLEAVPAIVAEIPRRAKNMVPQALSNCFWAAAQLKDVAPGVLEGVPSIAAQILERATDMVPQALSNCLWASAKLKDAKDVAPHVLDAVRAIVAQIPDKAKDMKPQELSNCLWACAQLKDELSEVLDIVPAIVAEIPPKIKGMNGQDLSNTVEALVLLRDSVPEVAGFLVAGGSMDDILRSAAARLNTLLPRLRGKDLSFAVPVVVWACAKAEVYDGEFLGSVARRLGSRSKLSSLPDFGVRALSWSYQVLDTEDDFEDFKTLLMSETEKRGFSEADVQSCQFGRSDWKRFLRALLCLLLCLASLALFDALRQLHAGVEHMVLQDQLNAQVSANVLWSIARLFDQFSIPTQLLAALAKSFPSKARGGASDCQAKPPAQLKGEVPTVLEIVPALVGEIPTKLRNMKLQEMSNGLEARIFLRDSDPQVAAFLAAGGNVADIVGSAAARLNMFLPQARGKDLSMTVPVILWACAASKCNLVSCWLQLPSDSSPEPECHVYQASVYVPCHGRIKCLTSRMTSQTFASC
eukprot:s243_g16.t1